MTKKSTYRDSIAFQTEVQVQRRSSDDGFDIVYQEGNPPEHVYCRMPFDDLDLYEFLKKAMYWAGYHAFNSGFTAGRYGQPNMWDLGTGEVLDYTLVEDDDA